MSNYMGVKCPVCSKKFSQGDDIVVCPICGAPHHRECYAQKGECVFVEEHLSGKEWQIPEEDQPPEEEASTRQCPSCGASNPGESIFCQVCGNRMVGLGNGAQQDGPQGGQAYQGWGVPGGFGFNAETILYGGLSPDEEIDGEKVRDLATNIGQNAAYFLPRFRMYSSGANPVSINFSALLFNFMYFFYRKMYWVGLVLLLLSAIGAVPYLLYVREMMPELLEQPDAVPFLKVLEQWNVSFAWPTTEVNHQAADFYYRIYVVFRVLNLGARLAAAMFANMLYYKKVLSSVKKIRKTVGESLEATRYNTALAYYGGVSTGSAALGFLLFGVVYFAVYLFIFSSVL